MSAHSSGPTGRLPCDCFRGPPEATDNPGTEAAVNGFVMLRGRLGSGSNIRSQLCTPAIQSRIHASRLAWLRENATDMASSGALPLGSKVRMAPTVVPQSIQDRMAQLQSQNGSGWRGGIPRPDLQDRSCGAQNKARSPFLFPVPLNRHASAAEVARSLGRIRPFRHRDASPSA